MGLAGLAVLGSSVEGKALENTAEEEFSKQDKDKKELFMDSSAEESVENSIGKVLNIEAEDSDLELRTCSLHELGFLTEEDFDKEFAKFYKQTKNEYTDYSVGTTEGRSIYTKLYLRFINQKMKEKGGSESFILTSKEWDEVKAEFDRLSVEIPQRSQVGIINQTIVGNKIETTFAVNRAERGDTGEIEIDHFTTNTPMSLDNREMVIKVLKK